MNGVAVATVPRYGEALAQVRGLALLDALERAVDGVDEVEVADVVGPFLSASRPCGRRAAPTR